MKKRSKALSDLRLELASEREKKERLLRANRSVYDLLHHWHKLTGYHQDLQNFLRVARDMLLQADADIQESDIPF